MNCQNNINYSVIADPSQKYNEINKKVISFTKQYFHMMKNHAYQLTLIERQMNEYNLKEEVKVKPLLDNQFYLIKELIKIINTLLSERRGFQVSKKLKNPVIHDSLKTNKTKTTNISHAFFKPYYVIDNSYCQLNNIKESRMNSKERMMTKSENSNLRNKSTSIKKKNEKKNTKSKTNFCIKCCDS